MRNCREISALISQGLDKKLSLRERFSIKLHDIICPHCRNFEIQIRFMRKAAHRYTEQLQSRLDKK